MPSISEFFGIAIYIYYNDYAPPHFHAEYAEHEALFLIDTLEVYEGELPRRSSTGFGMGITSPFRVDIRLGEGTARTATGTDSTAGMNNAGRRIG